VIHRRTGEVADEYLFACLRFAMPVYFRHLSVVHRVHQKSHPAKAQGRINMQRLVAASTVLLFLVLVITRIFLMRRTGVNAVYFANIDKKDFLIPPFAFLYIYIVIAAPLGLPPVTKQEFSHSEALSWVGVFLCLLGLLLFLVSLVSFGRSFRVGIDTDHPGKLVTTGVFALSRNPIYVAFWIIMLGQFLIFPNWILLAYLPGAAWLFHRQVLREEEFLEQHYDQEYLQYCNRVRRYL
jgi:protein-S-isoprenylcysteine O-methyltransferase Ste14